MNTLYAITIIYDPDTRQMTTDVGTLPAPLAQRLLAIAADELADLQPVDIVTTVVGGAEHRHNWLEDDGGDDE